MYVISKLIVSFTKKNEPMRIFMIIGVVFFTMWNTDIAAQSTGERFERTPLAVAIVINNSDLNSSNREALVNLWTASRQEGTRTNTDPSTLTRAVRRTMQRERFNRFLTSIEAAGLLNQDQFADLQTRLTR